jgi:nucleoid-associated protein YgaU
MFDDVDKLDGQLKYIASLVDQVQGKLGDRFLRIELADHLAPKSTPFRVPTGLGEAIDKRIAPAGLDALHLLRAIRDVNKDVPDNPDKVDAVVAAIGKLKRSMIPLSAEVAIQIGFK